VWFTEQQIVQEIIRSDTDQFFPNTRHYTESNNIKSQEGGNVWSVLPVSAHKAAYRVQSQIRGVKQINRSSPKRKKISWYEYDVKITQDINQKQSAPANYKSSLDNSKKKIYTSSLTSSTLAFYARGLVIVHLLKLLATLEGSTSTRP
jgi:hypothetical protein